MNFLMSYYPEAKINVILDPCLPRDVEGDVVKFHQIMISLIDFALKSSNSVNIDSKAIYDMKLGGFIVHFEISFVSGFAYNEVDLRTMFNLQDDIFIKSLKANKSIGLALNLTARLLKVIGGSFNRVTLDKEGKTILSFEIPFKMADFSNYPYIQIPTLRALLEPNREEAYIERVPTADKCIQKVNIHYTQESGNDGSLCHRSRDVLVTSNDVLKNSLTNNPPATEKSNISHNRTGRFAVQKPLTTEADNQSRSRMAKTYTSDANKPSSPEMRLNKIKIDEEVGQVFMGRKSPSKPKLEESKNEANNMKSKEEFKFFSEPVSAQKIDKIKEKEAPKPSLNLAQDDEFESNTERRNKDEESKRPSLRKKKSIPRKLERESSLQSYKMQRMDKEEKKIPLKDQKTYVAPKMVTAKYEEKEEYKLDIDSALDSDFGNLRDRKRNSIKLSNPPLHVPLEKQKSKFRENSKENDPQLKGIESIVRKNLLKSITEGIRCSQITKSRHSSRKRRKSSSLIESNSQKSLEKLENKELVHKDSMKRMITFSSELDQFAKQGLKDKSESAYGCIEEFDEQSHLSEKLQLYEYESLGGSMEELGASKNIMDFAAFRRQMETPLDASKKARRRKTLFARPSQIFGLSNEMQRVPAKELEEKESPKFST